MIVNLGKTYYTEAELAKFNTEPQCMCTEGHWQPWRGQTACLLHHPYGIPCWAVIDQGSLPPHGGLLPPFLAAILGIAG